MILARYIARRFLRMVLIVFVIFLWLMMLIDLLDQIRRFKQAAITLAQAAQLSALKVPETLYTILPLIVILAAVALFLGLARSSELVVVRSAGRSGLRFLVAPVVVAVLLGIFAVSVLDPIVAGTSRRYEAMAGRLDRGGSVLSLSKEGLWLRQGSDAGQMVIHAGRASPEGTRLFSVSFLRFDPGGRPVTRVDAAEAVLKPGFWLLTGARTWDLLSANPEASSDPTPRDGIRVASDLTAERIRAGFGKPSSIPIWDLPAYIAELERAGFAARQHRIWMQMEFALPLMLVAMVLVAAGFTMRHARSGGTGRMVLLALLAGFGLFFLRSFAQVLGENGQIAIVLAAWSPPVIGIMGSLGLLLHLEDG